MTMITLMGTDVKPPKIDVRRVATLRMIGPNSSFLSLPTSLSERYLNMATKNYFSKKVCNSHKLQPGLNFDSQFLY